MKNFKNKLIFVSALLIIIGSAFYFKQSTNSNSENKTEQSITKAQSSKKSSKLADKLSENEISSNTEKLSKFNDFEVTEKKSLIILSSFLNDAAKDNLSMTELVEDLKELKLKPVIMKNENEYTGALNIVRTKEALPGTRYVHAQYFEGENATSTLQHLSYEFRGGVGAFEMAKQTIKMQMQLSTPPIEESSTFVSWSVGDKIVWIKQLNLEDISKANPFNSYDLKTDVGTIRVTVENEIH